MAKRSNVTPSKPLAPPSISRITVSGFKSIGEEQSIEIAPLTILAGANSSGKSSMMQPLLLLKQTLECNYDPGALLLDDPNVKFTASEQLLTRNAGGRKTNSFSVKIESSSNLAIQTTLEGPPGKVFSVSKTRYFKGDSQFAIQESMTKIDLNKTDLFKSIKQSLNAFGTGDDIISVRHRCFLKLAQKTEKKHDTFIC